MSGRAVEAAGDVTTLLLDKTGTITHGNRRATEFVRMDGVGEDELAGAAALASLADPTPEGTSSSNSPQLRASCPSAFRARYSCRSRRRPA